MSCSSFFSIVTVTQKMYICLVSSPIYAKPHSFRRWAMQVWLTDSMQIAKRRPRCCLTKPEWAGLMTRLWTPCDRWREMCHFQHLQRQLSSRELCAPQIRGLELIENECCNIRKTHSQLQPWHKERGQMRMARVAHKADHMHASSSPNPNPASCSYTLMNLNLFTLERRLL